MEETKSKGGFVLSIIKGTAISLIFILAGVLIFAGVVKLAALSDNVIKPVNQFIKALAVFVGCFFSIKGKLGFVKGGLVGISSTVISYLIFALLGGGLSFGLSFLIDIAFSFAAGMLSGILAVNLKKE